MQLPCGSYYSINRDMYFCKHIFVCNSIIRTGHTKDDRIDLRVVPHFSSGIAERAKRERAWKSPHARKGDTRRGERKTAFFVFFLLLFLSHPHPPYAGIWSSSYRHPVTVKTIYCEKSNKFSELFIFSPTNSWKPLIGDTSEVLLSDWLVLFWRSILVDLTYAGHKGISSIN